MRIQEITSRSDEELVKLVADKRRDLFALRMRLQTGQLENTNLIKQTRKDLARALTVLNRRRDATKGSRDGGS